MWEVFLGVPVIGLVVPWVVISVIEAEPLGWDTAKRVLAKRPRRRPEPSWQDPSVFADLYAWKRDRRQTDLAEWQAKFDTHLSALPPTKAELAAHTARKVALKVLPKVEQATVHSFPIGQVRVVPNVSWHRSATADVWRRFEAGELSQREVVTELKWIDRERKMHGQPGHRGW